MKKQQVVTVTIQVPNGAVAMALAQFVKRLGWQELRQNAVSEGEAYLMRDGVDAVQRGLSDSGFSPR